MIKTILITLICIYSSSILAFAPKELNCADDIAMLYRLGKAYKSENSDALSNDLKEFFQRSIFDFYFFDTDRFINTDIKLIQSSYGKTLLGGEDFFLKFDDIQKQDFHVFHNFANTDRSKSYAATLGVSVVNVRVMGTADPLPFVFEQKSFALASDNGFKVPMFFQSTVKGGARFNVYQYMHGPNYEQLHRLYKVGKISEEKWSLITARYKKLLADFEGFTKTNAYREFAAEFGDMSISPKSLSYYNENWYILEL